MHKELLMTEAKKLQIPFSTKEVERSVEKGLAFFEHMLGHQDFCSQKSVTPLRNCAPYIHLEVWRFSLKIFDILKAAIQLNGALNVLLSPDIRERLSAFRISNGWLLAPRLRHRYSSKFLQTSISLILKRLNE